jgi:hypothetical protein
MPVILGLETTSVKTLGTIKLGGPITAAYRKIGDTYYCNALQFDIVGTGDTEKLAFEQLKGLLRGYFLHVVALIADGQKVRFFNPAPDEEWNDADRRVSYNVVFIVDADERAPQGAGEIHDLVAYKDAIESIDLIPA